VISIASKIANIIVRPQIRAKAFFLYIVHLPFFGRRKKRRPSIIRRTCAFDSKNGVFGVMCDFVSAYVERDKNFFRKIEICCFLQSFFAEKIAKSARELL